MKLLLSFTIVSLVGASIFFVVARWNSQTKIQEYLSERMWAQIVDQATEYYLKNGSWEGFEEYWPARELNYPSDESLPPPFSPFTLFDKNQQVVFTNERQWHNNPGDILSSQSLENAIEINLKGEVIGWLLFNNIYWHEVRPRPTIFRSMDTLLIFSALGSLVVAIILGLILSRRLSMPLLELSSAAQKAATGDLSHKVQVNTKDEIGSLATSFNQMMKDLENLITARKQMTADIAHELRTPISIILGYAEGVQDGILKPNAENFEIIRDEALRLERLVNDLKILSQADVKELPLDKREFSIQKLVNEVERTIESRLFEKKITLKIDVEPNLPSLIIDPDRILQAIRNILDNSIRYSPKGSEILIQAKQQQGYVQLSITDNGPGLSSEELEKIFQRFYRTDSARTRDIEGSGLGLAISQSIIEQHKGKVWAENHNAKGLKLVILLPIVRNDFTSKNILN